MSMTFTAREMAETVRRARQARGLSLQQLAELACIGKTAMFDLEHGNSGIRLRTLLAVLEVLELDLQFIGAAAPAVPRVTEPEPSNDELPDRLL
jgi:transcriptional regulator with XRE-family HTH domain